MGAREQHSIYNQLIFISDENPSTCTLLQDLLMDEGYTQIRVVAREDMFRAARDDQPALLLVDVHGAAPASDLQLLRELRQDSRTTGIAVIICSTMQREAWQNNLQTRAIHDIYIEKPFQIADLLYHVAAVLSRDHTSD